MIGLSKPQLAIYEMDRYIGGSVANIAGDILFSDCKDPSKLVSIVNQLVQKNESLRTKLILQNGVPMQMIQSKMQLDIPILEFETFEKYQAWAQDDALKPLDIFGELVFTAVFTVKNQTAGVYLKIHHIISDAWSFGIIGEQLKKLYKGEEVVSYSYTEYLQKEALYQDSNRYTKDKEYRLNVYDSNNELNYLCEKQTKTNLANRYSVSLDIDVTHKVKQFCSENEISPFAFFVSVFSTYYYRIKGNNSFYIGTPVLNRSGNREKNTIGAFINTIPVSIVVDDNNSFDMLAKNITSQISRDFRRQRFLYSDLLKVLREEKGHKDTLFDVVISYQNMQVGENKTNWYFQGCQSESLQIHIDDRDKIENFNVNYDYQTEKFTENDVKKLHEYLLNIIDCVVKDKDIAIPRVKMLSSDEEHTLLYTFNDTKVDYPKDKCVHHLFEEQVAKTPDKTAVIACDKTLTYNELNEQANRIAHSLIQKGVKPNDIVAFILPRRSYLIATMFGILKSGVAYMPIDPDYPQDRIEYMLEDSGAKICIDESNIEEFLSCSDVGNPNVEMDSSSLCYCIYTSGSTGIPKGVSVTHSNLYNYLYYAISQYNNYPCNMPVLTSICVDLTITSLFLPILTGGFLEIVYGDLLDNIQYVFSSKRFNTFKLTPTHLDIMKNLNVCISNDSKFVIGGEQLKLSNLNYVCQNSTLFNEYGPTETTVGCSVVKHKSFKDKCVHQLFEEQVAKTPDKTAVIACDKTLTYNELNEQANKIAHSLMQKGVKPNDIVAFILPRRSYLISAMFGILKSGAAYMPIDPDYPQDRIEYMLQDSGAKICIDESNIEEFLSCSDVGNPNVEMDSSSLCYCIYTSGSTGNPKGTLIKHSNVVNLISWEIISRDFSTKINFISSTSISFDVACQEIFTALTNNCILYLTNDSVKKNLSNFCNYIVVNKIQVLFTTPTYFNQLTITTDNTEKLFDTLTDIILAGERFYLNDKCIKANKLKRVKIHNHYGPAETHVVSTSHTYNQNDIHIGKPIANTQIYILDKHQNLLPIGAVGELCIAGDGVGAGYLNRPELTAEKFVPNPFGEGKMYKTGDLARWRADGNIEYIGRNDFQVKIRGLRIELGEIENVLSSYNGVKQAVVVVQKDDNDRQYICAFYVADNEFDVKDIRSFMGEKLPQYMIPHIFTRLDTIPQTSSGKINRKGLPKVSFDNIMADEYIEPTTPIQKEIANLMCSVLNLTRVGITDNFFYIGGDSLKAIELSAKMNDSYGVTTQILYQNPTPEGLEQWINAKNDVVDNRHDNINELIKHSVKDSCKPPKNILLTGASGFLGAHILNELEKEGYIVTCLVRNDDKFHKSMDYYFNRKPPFSFNILYGDIEKELLGLEACIYSELASRIDAVIHTAANVKHAGEYSQFDHTNVIGTQNILDFCKQSGAVLHYTSTMGVSGEAAVGQSNDNMVFNEFVLDIGQKYKENAYIHSKYKAEERIIMARAEGLVANIYRIGNLTWRISDGLFQINSSENGFVSRINAFLKLNAYPVQMRNMPIEFTPVDECAKAITAIVKSSKVNEIFHLNSPYAISLENLVKMLSSDANAVDLDVFSKLILENISDNYIAILSFYMNMIVKTKPIKVSSDYTINELSDIGFEWSRIDSRYVTICKNCFFGRDKDNG